MKQLKRITALLMCAACFAVSTAGVSAASVNGNYISSKGACVMDYETGEVLYHHDGYTPRVPASMTKLMTMYLVYEALEKGEISLNTNVPVSKRLYNKSRETDYTIPLNYDAGYTVDELIDITVVYSANSTAVALAELLGNGNEYVFVEKMNNKVRAMGLDAYFYDSCGLAENMISPVSMAQLARNIIRDYPDILNRSSKKSVYFRGKTYDSTNWLLSKHYYAGADGLKTGTKISSGYCFCGTATRNGERVITVTMNSSSKDQRFADTKVLLDYGFERIENREGVFFTNMRTFINGSEMPTFVYKGDNTYAAVIAEDLKDYGFDVVWENTTKTLYLKYNKDKWVSGIPLDYYRNKNGQKAYNVVKNNPVKVIVEKDGVQHLIENVHNLNGYMCMSIDEFQKMYNFEWNSEDMAAYIVVE